MHLRLVRHEVELPMSRGGTIDKVTYYSDVSRFPIPLSVREYPTSRWGVSEGLRYRTASRNPSALWMQGSEQTVFSLPLVIPESITKTRERCPRTIVCQDIRYQRRRLHLCHGHAQVAANRLGALEIRERDDLSHNRLCCSVHQPSAVELAHRSDSYTEIASPTK
jgi:hypothetical protein